MIVPYEATRKGKGQLVLSGIYKQAKRKLLSPAAAAGAAYGAKKLFEATKRLRTSMGSGGGAPRSAPQIGTKTSKRQTGGKKAKNTKELIKKVARLEERVRDVVSEHIVRKHGANTVQAQDNSAGYRTDIFSAKTDLESALGAVRYFDPSTPGTLISADLGSPTYSQKIKMKSYTKYTIRNNYQVPCDVTLYLLEVREDTTILPETARTDGLSDVGAPSSSSAFVYPTDSPVFMQLWKIKQSKKCRLECGKEFSMTHGNEFMFDPSEVDSHDSTYQRGFKTYAFMIRVKGVLGHDSVNFSSEFGLVMGQVDASYATTYTVIYNSGGASIKTIVLNNQLDQFTNAGRLGLKPVSDIQGWSAT